MPRAAQNRRLFYYHPEVIESWWQTYTAAEWWEASWIISKLFCQIAPDCARAWLCQAHSLRRCAGLRAAKDLLVSMSDRFPDEPILPYTLACYSCQLGQMQESCTWLLSSFELAKVSELRLVALLDPDLEPLWRKVIECRLPSRAKKATRSTSVC